MPASSTGPAARISLLLGVAVTAVSFTALLIILGLYFAEARPHPGLYWAALWGFPVGFALMCGYLLATLRTRRRVALSD